MKVSVEEISTVEKKIVVELAAAQVDSALNEQYKRIAKTARVRGFRQGKVPRTLLRRMFKADAENGASQALIQGNVVAAITESELQPLSVPDVERDPITEGQSFVFKMFCQVRPEFEVQGLDDMLLESEPVEPGDEALQAELERRRETQAELVPVEDRGADIGDTVTIDFVGRLADAEEPFEGGTGTDHDVELGSGSLIPGFEDQLAGMKVGDEGSIEVTFPEPYGSDELAGKPAVFQVTVKAVRSKVLPDIDDELAVDLGFEDLSGLRASVYDQLATAMREEAQGRLREQILDGLLATNPIEIPGVLLEQAAQRLQSQLGMHLSMGGMPPEQVRDALGRQSEMISTRAKELAHRDLVLEAISSLKGIEVADGDLDVRVGEIAEQTGQPRAKVRATLQQGDRLEGLREEMLHEKTMEWLEGYVITPLDERLAAESSGDADESAPDEEGDAAEAQAETAADETSADETDGDTVETEETDDA